MVKSTISLPKRLWLWARMQAFSEGIGYKDLVQKALEHYRKTVEKKGGPSS